MHLYLKTYLFKRIQVFFRIISKLCAHQDAVQCKKHSFVVNVMVYVPVLHKTIKKAQKLLRIGDIVQPEE